VENVGIKILKNELSKYLTRVRCGERFVITDRGREVAELGPISEERKVIQSMHKKGSLSWSGGKPDGLKGVVVAGKPVADTVLSDRR